MRRTSTFRRHRLARPRGLAARTPPRFQDRPARSLLRRLVRPIRHRGHHPFLCLAQVPTWVGTPKLPLRRRWRRMCRWVLSPLATMCLTSKRSPPYSMASLGPPRLGFRDNPGATAVLFPGAIKRVGQRFREGIDISGRNRVPVNSGHLRNDGSGEGIILLGTALDGESFDLRSIEIQIQRYTDRDVIQCGSESGQSDQSNRD